MKKTFQMQELDCAHCAAKMEDKIRKLPGVESASISFMAQKLTIEAPKEKMDEILAEAQKICRQLEPDCVIKRWKGAVL